MQSDQLSQPGLILASASPRRLALLEQAGIKATVAAVDIDESVVGDEPAAAMVQRLARNKAERCAEKLQGEHHKAREARVILAADTVIELDQRILGKPRNRSDALTMLGALSGRVHSVHTGVCVKALNHPENDHLSGETLQCLVTTRVTMTTISEAAAQSYWESGEPAGKAGSYAIQGLGAQFIAHLSGSYSNVVGLPLFETLALLASAGICKA